jgi:hypothetical protein
MDGIPMGAAPYRVMEDIENYNKLGGLKKELNDTIMSIQMVNLVSARQKEAIIASARLQFQGVTENQILNVCIRIEVNGTQRMN